MLKSSLPSSQNLLKASLILVNGSVRTMDEARPLASAVAIVGNRIAAVGSTSEMQDLACKETHVIDAGGNLVLPGFNDAHVHFLEGGFSLANVNLRTATSPEELCQRLRDYARTVPPGSWILGGEWDHENWPGAPLPARSLIDSVTPEHPVLVHRHDCHMALANSSALRLARVSRQTADPAGGVVVREPRSGEPTGLLKDSAISLVQRVIPPRTFEEKCIAARAASAHAARAGVTSVTDMSADEDISVYQHLLERGELNTRINAARSIVDWELLARLGVTAGFGNEMLRIGALKGFADGSLGSSTALFFEPYLDVSENRGLLFDQMLPEGTMLQRAEAADKCGLQIMVHAIGDEANLRILDLFQAIEKRNGKRDRRSRIEHAQHLRPSEIPRFAQQQVIASMQPYHLADDGRWCDRRIGTKRSRGAYAFRSLLDSGAILAFGSDWPVAPLDPLPGIQAAVTRQTLDGKHPKGWVPEERISVEEAVRGWTMRPAYAEFADKYKGTITPGKLADLVILEQDIYHMEPAEIGRVKVSCTIMNGCVVFPLS